MSNFYKSDHGLLQVAAADLSDGTTGSGSIVLATAPTLAGLTVTGTATLATVTASSNLRTGGCTLGDVGFLQLANGDDTLVLQRVTDSSPTGNLINCRTAANSGSLFTVSIGGTISVVQGVSTTAAGVPQIRASISSGPSAAVTNQSLVSSGVAGRWLITFHVQLTTPGTSSSVLGGTNGFTLSWTSQDGSVSMSGIKPTYTLQSSSLSANTTSTFFSGTAVVAIASSTNITFSIDYTSVGGTPMAYEYRVNAMFMG